MFAPQSSVSRQGTAGYRPDLNTKIPDECSLDTVGGFQGCANTCEAWTQACDEFDRQFGEGISRQEVEEYVKVAAGFKSECGNKRFTDAVRVLSEKTQPEPDLRGGVTRDQVNLLVTIYATAIGAINAFLDCGDLNQAGFVGFTARSLNTTPDAVRDAIPAGWLDGIVLEEEVRSAAGTGCGATERKVRLREAQCWVQVGTACGFEVLPAEMHGLIFEFLPSRADHQRLAATSRTMREALREQLLTDRMAVRAENLWLEVHVLWLLGDTDGSREKGLHPGAIGALPPRGRAKVLAIMADHIEQLHPSKRQWAFDRSLGAALSLPPDYQGRPLVALAETLEMVDDKPANEFGKLVGAVGTLPDRAYASLLVAALADNLGLLEAHDRATMFDRLLTATNELRCRNENRPSALPMKNLGNAFGKLSDEEREEATNHLFKMVTALPCDDREQALVELTFNFPAQGDHWTGAPLDAMLKAIEGLPLRSRIRPLTALSKEISVLRLAGSARATCLVLDTIQELEPHEVTIDLIKSLAISAALKDLPTCDKPAMFERLLAAPRRLLDGNPAWSAEQMQSAELPLRRLWRVVGWLPASLRKTALSDLLAVGRRLADSSRGSFLSDLSEQTWHGEYQ